LSFFFLALPNAISSLTFFLATIHNKTLAYHSTNAYERIGISAELLKWKGIEATEKFADAPNTKIVIVGTDSSGLPVILSADKD
jgi:hypothetical protein